MITVFKKSLENIQVWRVESISEIDKSGKPMIVDLFYNVIGWDHPPNFSTSTFIEVFCIFLYPVSTTQKSLPNYSTNEDIINRYKLNLYK